MYNMLNLREQVERYTQNDLIALLVEIEISGSFITSFISFEWMHPYVAQYHIWVVENRVRRWNKYRGVIK